MQLAVGTKRNASEQKRTKTEQGKRRDEERQSQHRQNTNLHDGVWLESRDRHEFAHQSVPKALTVSLHFWNGIVAT